MKNMNEENHLISDKAIDIENGIKETCKTKQDNGLNKEFSAGLQVDSFGLFGRPSFLRARWWKRKRTQTFSWIGKILSVLIYIAYMIYAIWYHPENVMLLVFDCCILIIWVAAHAEKSKRILIMAGKKIVKANEKLIVKIPFLRKIITTVILLSIFCFLIYDWYHDLNKLVPFGGLVFLLLMVFITSRSPTKVKWTPVIWGLILQFAMGLLILRWSLGYATCKFIGEQITIFFSYTDVGSIEVFGEKGLKDHPVIFKALPVVIFFSAIINILYYLGAMQVIIRAIARVLKFAMKTSPLESFATSAHIFVGHIESSIALKPFLNDISRSELNTIMTGGFATVAATVLGAYIEFGVPANHLIAASFMSAPAALAVSKLGWPETEEVENVDMENINLYSGNASNLMEAAAAGAMSTVKLIGYVIVNVIAFLAILAFFDAIVSFYGDRVGHPEINFEWLCSYIFMPLAVVIGIPWDDCRTVATLIGKKIVLNEVIAYIDLGTLIKENKIQGRSAVIVTYLLCGFGSISSMGINLGALTAAEPNRRKDYAKGVFRAFVFGNIACFMTACIAGMLYTETVPVFTNSTELNMTSLNVSSYNLTILNSSQRDIGYTVTANKTG